MKIKKIHPYIIIILTFLCVILFGTILLLMPFASKSGKSFGFVDSLFMLTSAVCVTGLSVMDVAASMTIYGKIVLCILMEIGGLSFLTIAVFFFTIIGAKIGVSNRFLLKEALNQNSIKGIISLVKKIATISFVIQSIGAFINMFSLLSYCDGNFFKAFGYSVFHAVASFNNAGFDLFGSESMIGFSDDLILNGSTMLLIVTGGLGFVVLDDIIKAKKWKKFNLHTKITLLFTFILIVAGTFLIKLSMSHLSWLQALFTAITSRTAGFTTIDMATLSSPTYVVVLSLMFIGASPCSTGGGIKTTTMAIIFLTIVNFARGKRSKVFHRTIPDASVFKAFVLFTVAIIVVLTTTFLVAMIQPELGLKEILFEVTSAFSTTGLSMGITANFNPINRLLISLLMLFGRLGPLTVIGVVNKNWMSDVKDQIQYVEEKVIIG